MQGTNGQETLSLCVFGFSLSDLEAYQVRQPVAKA
jgi:hypothetical protein